MTHPTLRSQSTARPRPEIILVPRRVDVGGAHRSSVAANPATSVATPTRKFEGVLPPVAGTADGTALNGSPSVSATTEEIFRISPDAAAAIERIFAAVLETCKARQEVLAYENDIAWFDHNEPRIVRKLATARQSVLPPMQMHATDLRASVAQRDGGSAVVPVVTQPHVGTVPLAAGVEVSVNAAAAVSAASTDVAAGGVAALDGLNGSNGVARVEEEEEEVIDDDERINHVNHAHHQPRQPPHYQQFRPPTLELPRPTRAVTGESASDDSSDTEQQSPRSPGIQMRQHVLI